MIKGGGKEKSETFKERELRVTIMENGRGKKTMMKKKGMRE